MLITGTSDKIQFKLGSNATTELPFTVDYNNYTSTGVSLISNNGTSNDTTEVNLVPSPASGEQNELRYCSIYNADSASETVIIQIYDGVNTRIVFRATLAVGDTLQYQLEKGWEVITNSGNRKTFGIEVFGQYGAVKGLASWRGNATNGALALTSTTWFGWYMGRAEKAYSSVNFMFNTVSTASSTTYGEAAIYASPITHTDSLGSYLGRRLGVTNITSSVTTTGVKTVTVSVSDVKPGERLYFIIAGQWTPNPQIRAVNFVDGTGTNHTVASPIAGSGARPSLARQAYPQAGTNGAWILWQGT